MAQVTARTDLGDLVVVLDDPFTSLDEFRQTWTCYSIRKLAEKAKQVVVLSHSLEFLRLIAKNCTGIPIKNLKLDFIAGDTEIVEFDLETATACNVDKNVMILKSFYHGEDKNALAAIRAIRPALENYISGMAPDDCPRRDGGWLGEFLSRCQCLRDRVCRENVGERTATLPLARTDASEIALVGGRAQD